MTEAELKEPSEVMEIVRDLIYIIKHDRDGLILRYGDEPDPDALDLILRPRAAEKKESALTTIPKTERDTPPTRKMENLPANYLCSLCENRMYPVRKYYRRGNLPILILHHNGPMGSPTPRPDRSDRHIFGNEEEDGLFTRMCKAAGFRMEDFHFQEFPACHFGAHSVPEEEWKIRMRNCIGHVKKTVQDKGIRILIFMGPSAVLYFGKDEALKRSTTMEIADSHIDGLRIPSIVIRSPAAILAMEKKRTNADEENRKKLTIEEAAVKRAILESLRRCRALIQDAGEIPTRDS